MSILVQSTHGWWVLYMTPPSMETPWSAACRIAFCSACRPRHSSWVVPDGAPASSRRQPIVEAVREPPRGAVVAGGQDALVLDDQRADLRRRHVERPETTFAMLKKYSSQVGRIYSVSSAGLTSLVVVLPVNTTGWSSMQQLQSDPSLYPPPRFEALVYGVEGLPGLDAVTHPVDLKRIQEPLFR